MHRAAVSAALCALASETDATVGKLCFAWSASLRPVQAPRIWRAVPSAWPISAPRTCAGTGAAPWPTGEQPEPAGSAAWRGPGGREHLARPTGPKVRTSGPDPALCHRVTIDVRKGGRGYGLILFASVLLLVIGFFNMIYGIAAIANSHVFVANAHYVFANLRTWGWITLIISVLQLIAAGGILAGNQLARWFAVAVVGLSAIDMMFFVPAYPFWALAIIAMDVVALYGLCAYGS